MSTRVLETRLVFYAPKGEAVKATPATGGLIVETAGDRLSVSERSNQPPDAQSLLNTAARVLESTGLLRYRSYGLRFVGEFHDEHPHPIAARIAKATLNGAALQEALRQKVVAAEVVLTSFDEEARRYTLTLAPVGGSLGTHLVRAELAVHIEESLDVPGGVPTLHEALEAGHPRLERWTRAAIGLGGGNYT